jgi:predicted small secreted protein
MVRTAVVVALLTAVGLSLAGCGPCGFGFSISGTPLICRGEPGPQR